MPSRRHGLTTRRTGLGLGLTVGVLLTTAACGGDSDAESEPGPVVVTPSAVLSCTASSGLDLPGGWPAQVPLPSGLVVTRTERRSGERLIAYGRVPGDFHAVVDFFNAQLPAAGFTQKNGEIDPRDAESNFSGTKVQGRWTTGGSGDCPGTSDVSVLVLPIGGDVGEDEDD